MTNKKDISSLTAWVESSPELIDQYKFVLSRGTIIMTITENRNLIVTFETDEGVGEFKLEGFWYDISKKSTTHICSLHGNRRDGGDFTLTSCDTKVADSYTVREEHMSEEDAQRQVGKGVFAVFVSVMLYMEHNIEEKEGGITNRRESFKVHDEDKKKKKRKQRKLIRRCYTLNIDPERVKRTIKRHTEAWTVRGHWRNLSEGRRVWVKTYIKGNPNKLEQSEYALGGGDLSDG